MSDTKVIDKKMPETSQLSLPSSEEVDLVCRWWDRKQDADNGLSIAALAGTDALGCIKFELKGRSEKEEGYGNLLCAKIFETFGVYNPGVAANALTDCVNCIVTNSNIMEKELEEGKAFLEKLCENVLSLFQEMRPRDVMELMMVTKLIILDFLSNREFIGSVATQYEDRRTGRQLRAIKLSRLLLEFKDKLDKHRKPEQQIHMQHNHIHNEGQAIIGSQISTGGGR